MLERLVPTQAVEHVWQIDLAALRAAGVKHILLDLDNTITPWRSVEVPPKTADWIAQARGDFRVCIVSNTSRMKRLGTLRDALGVECVGFAQKPWGTPRALRKLGLAPDQTVLVGDQLLTDVYGAHLAGIRSILVRPVSGSEFFTTYLLRAIECLLLRVLERRGMFERPW
jgi:HAD superfamily phosphatase (TIGR01668 family)